VLYKLMVGNNYLKRGQGHSVGRRINSIKSTVMLAKNLRA